MRDPEAFVAKLRTDADSVSTYVYGRLAADTRAELETWQPGATPAKLLKDLLVRDLKWIVKGESIWDEARFKGVKLREKTKSLLASGPMPAERVVLNRLLLEDSYPFELSRVSQRSYPQIALTANSDSTPIDEAADYSTVLNRPPTSQGASAKILEVWNWLQKKWKPLGFLFALLAAANFVVTCIPALRVESAALSKGIPATEWHYNVINDSPFFTATSLEVSCWVNDMVIHDTNQNVVGRFSENWFDLRGTPMLGLDDLRDMTSLLTKIRANGEATSAYIRGQLRATTASALEAWTPSNPPEKPMVTAFLEDLNSLIRSRPIWNADVFRGVVLRQETRALLASRPSGRDAARLNRLLLEDAYPSELRIAPSMTVRPRGERITLSLERSIVPRPDHRIVYGRVLLLLKYRWLWGMKEKTAAQSFQLSTSPSGQQHWDKIDIPLLPRSRISTHLRTQAELDRMGWEKAAAPISNRMPEVPDRSGSH